MMSVADAWRMRLRADLTAAMKARDADAIAALRTVMAAIDNAEAVALVDEVRANRSGAIAGAAVGVGSTEVARRELTDNEVERLIASHLADDEMAAQQACMHGHSERSDRLRRQAETLRAFMDGRRGWASIQCPDRDERPVGSEGRDGNVGA